MGLGSRGEGGGLVGVGVSGCVKGVLGTKVR